MRSPTDSPFTVRPARPTDSETLRAIEVAAGARFREIGMPEIADHQPMSVDVLAAYAEDGRSWVAVDVDELPIAYAVVDVVDNCAHLEQISVAPEYQGRGLGRDLIAEVEGWARANNLDALTLVTFAHVSWNAPLYTHLGFRVLSEHELT